jgi:WD40 repeat protein
MKHVLFLIMFCNILLARISDPSFSVAPISLDDPSFNITPMTLIGFDKEKGSLTLSPQGNYAAQLVNDGSLLIWDLNDNEASPRYFHPENRGSVHSLEFSPDEAYIALDMIAQKGGVLCIINLVTLEAHYLETLIWEFNQSSTFAFSSGGLLAYIPLGDNLSVVNVYSLADSMNMETFDISDSAITSLAFLNKEIVLGKNFRDGSVVLFDLKNMERVKTLETPENLRDTKKTVVKSLVASKDGSFVATHSTEKALAVVWDVETGIIKGNYAWHDELPITADHNWPYLMIADVKAGLNIFKDDQFWFTELFFEVDSNVAAASLTKNGRYLIGGSFNGFISASDSNYLENGPFTFGALDDGGYVMRIIAKDQDVLVLTDQGNLYLCGLSGA